MTNQDRAATLERIGQAVELRAAGATWQNVAARLGYASANAAEASVRKYLCRMSDGKDLGETLMMEELKLQQRERYIMSAAMKLPVGDIASRNIVDQARDRIAQHRARLHGLYAPVRQHVDVQVSQTPGAVVADAREKLMQMAATTDQAALETAIDAEVI
ncbi:hypothetical protein AB0B25_22725 [Nocardia sp. NPDC049190]|uniref:hypothetical protein n=1 Tax=Nocardia sp. NPDC049190 TaxID=3155650 RepID=UPI0033DB1DBC